MENDRDPASIIGENEESLKITKISDSYGVRFSKELAAKYGVEIKGKISFIIKQIIRPGESPQDTRIIVKDKEVIKSGGKYGGVIIDKDIADAQKLAKGTVINVLFIRV